ncbi:DUF1254 domain-containing protein [Robiginitalea aurantiaca]|uniref:DUF1254 domain-containing protein n=1 Tax=Robiginitalea aurantiaca TaxID=3056915 RepID=A0ABT7WDJ8_9FLAO|nr:DUF1254 domain-containing protein [Robiginitalea aurantiaca]MDM9630992.1 DUF1254 domain-containing protein [Robiginitalea aurantiaca]
MKFKFLLSTLLIALFIGCNQKAPELTPAEAKTIAKEAYIYGFPLVLNYKTMYSYTLDKKSTEYKGDFNQLGCAARVYTPEDKAVITPNSDTPYCMGWIDLRAEPVVFTIPEIENERFYQVQLIDLFTHNFAYISTVAKGNVPGKYLITGPDWKGEIPEGITEVIPCETQFLLAIARTQLFNPEDLDNVKNIQDGYIIESYSSFSGTKAPASVPAIEFPEWKDGTEFSAELFPYFDFMLTLVKTPEEEQALIERFAKIGLDGKGDFDISKWSPEIQEALEEGAQEGLAAMKEFAGKAVNDPIASGKIFGTRTFLNESAKANYNLNDLFIPRAMGALMGIYGNSGEEAIYPTYLTDAKDSPLDASKNNYTITFKKDEFPPVKAFWSLTMYDGTTQLLIDNPLDRYLLNSPMMDQFVLNADGSLTFYLQKESPGAALESNWLPAPNGPFYATMRLYGPKKEVLEGKWVAPELVKASQK